jgi:protein TonB
VLHLDLLAPRTPRLPRRRWDALTPVTASAALHLVVVVMAGAIATSGPGTITRRPESTANEPALEVTHLVLPALQLRGAAGGGGGGGNQRSDPIRRAQGVGTDAITLRIRHRPPPPSPIAARAGPPANDAPAIPSIVLDAKPLASGVFEQLGLPGAGVLAGTSTGTGGVGTGSGTGIGSGRGSGLGPGSGGGTGGGVYRAGGAVSAPRLITEVRPKYTNQALLRRIQGTVVMEAVVTSDGCASQIRVIRSLDPGGLDAEAVAAVAQWQFAPGRLAGMPVDVLVVILLDFTIR